MRTTINWLLKVLKIGYNEEEAQINALENLQINFDIKFKEVTDYDCI